jgi:hypothetical protein
MRSVRIRPLVMAAAIAALGASSAFAQDPAAPPPAPPPAAPAQPAPPASSRALNPDISVIGNFVTAAGKNEIEPTPSLQLTEAEVAFQAAVDPYAKADFFIAAGPEGAELEEGFITFTTLPAGLLLKAGKMRAEFGKVNRMHTHILPWADRPLVSRNLLGGEEGLIDSGLSLSRLIPNGFMYLEATAEVFQGSSEVFQTDRRSRLMWLGRVRGYRDITDNTNVDLGTTFAHGPTDAGPDLDRKLFGIDATFRWRPLDRALYRRFVARAELMWSQQDEPLTVEPLVAVAALAPLGGDDARTAFGFYASADYQFARRWYTGGRIDRSARALAPSMKDSGGTAHVTFWPTEFSSIRGQFRRINYAEGVSGNEVLFQLSFSIGAHGAHVF